MINSQAYRKTFEFYLSESKTEYVSPLSQRKKDKMTKAIFPNEKILE